MENTNNNYWDFIETWHPNYFGDGRIAEINDIERELEDYANIPEQQFNEIREELRRLTVKVFDEALCNYINKTWPGALEIYPKS